MSATIWRYRNDGEALGVLGYDEAVHEEDLESTDKLTVTSRESPDKRDRLVWRDAGGTWHEHIVDSTMRRHQAHRPRTESTCSNSISELYGVIASGTTVRGSVQQILSTLFAGTRWTAGACSDFGVTELEVWHKNVRQCIAELCEAVGGELETAVTVGDHGVTGRAARIVQERGSTSVLRQFAYGRNVDGITREVGADEVYTRVVGYGAKVNSSSEDDFAERVTVSVDSALDLAQWGVPNRDGTFAHNVMTYTDNGCTDATFLRKQCVKVLNVVSRPLVRYEFDVAEARSDIWGDVMLGDRVMCLDELFDPPLELMERVSHIRRRLSGRAECTIAIGARANPLVEQYKSNERVSRQYTGNTSRISSRMSPSTHGDYGSGSYQYDPGSASDAPDEIRVMAPPEKTTYYVGDKYDYSGIVVGLFKNGEPFTSEWYPDGTVPFGELAFPETVAQIDGEATEGWKGTFDMGGGSGASITLNGGSLDTPKTRWIPPQVTPDNWVFCDWFNDPERDLEHYHYYALAGDDDDFEIRAVSSTTAMAFAGELPETFYFLNGGYGQEILSNGNYTLFRDSIGFVFSGRGKITFVDLDGNRTDVTDGNGGFVGGEFGVSVPVIWNGGGGALQASVGFFVMQDSRWGGGEGGKF